MPRAVPASTVAWSMKHKKNLNFVAIPSENWIYENNTLAASPSAVDCSKFHIYSHIPKKNKKYCWIYEIMSLVFMMLFTEQLFSLLVSLTSTAACMTFLPQWIIANEIFETENWVIYHFNKVLEGSFENGCGYIYRRRCCSFIKSN